MTLLGKNTGNASKHVMGPHYGSTHPTPYTYGDPSNLERWFAVFCGNIVGDLSVESAKLCHAAIVKGN